MIDNPDQAGHALASYPRAHLQRIGTATRAYVSSRDRATRPLRAGNLLAHRVKQPRDRAAVALDRRGKVRAVGCA